MNELVIDKKKYVLITRKEYESLQKRASLKTRPEKIFTLAEARSHSKDLIRKWAKEK
jgi:hypothetical protein